MIPHRAGNREDRREPWLSACQPQQARLARHPRGVSEWPWSLPVCHTSLPDRAPVTCPPYRGGNWGSEGARTRSGGKRSLGGGKDARQAISGRPSPPEPQFPHLRDARDLTPRNSEIQLGANQSGCPREGTCSGARGPPCNPTHLISDHTRGTMVARLRAQGHSARPPLPVTAPQRPVGSVVAPVSRKGLRESKSPYGSGTPEAGPQSHREGVGRIPRGVIFSARLPQSCLGNGVSTAPWGAGRLASPRRRGSWEMQSGLAPPGARGGERGVRRLE